MNEENHMVQPFADDDLREDDYEIDADTQFEEQREERVAREPEDSFPLELRIRMMINRLDITNAFDKQQLIQLLKECQQVVASRMTGDQAS